jgi:hypothetical protein
VFKVGFFVFYMPTTSWKLAVNAVNVYAGRFTLYSLRYGIDLMLSEVQAAPTLMQQTAKGGRWSYLWNRSEQ